LTAPAGKAIAYVTGFGEGWCAGQLAVVDIDPDSTYGTVTPSVTGLCGAHDVQLNTTETSVYVVEVDARRFIRVDFLCAVYLLAVLRGQ